MLAKELVDHDNAFFKNKNKSSYRGGNGIPVLLGVELWVLRQRRLDLADARPPASGHLWPSARLPWTYRGRLASWVSLPGVTPARDRLVQGKVWKPSFPAMCQDALWGTFQCSPWNRAEPPLWDWDPWDLASLFLSTSRTVHTSVINHTQGLPSWNPLLSQSSASLGKNVSIKISSDCTEDTTGFIFIPSWLWHTLELETFYISRNDARSLRNY